MNMQSPKIKMNAHVLVLIFGGGVNGNTFDASRSGKIEFTVQNPFLSVRYFLNKVSTIHYEPPLP